MSKAIKGIGMWKQERGVYLSQSVDLKDLISRLDSQYVRFEMRQNPNYRQGTNRPYYQCTIVGTKAHNYGVLEDADEAIGELEELKQDIEQIREYLSYVHTEGISDESVSYNIGMAKSILEQL
jgi:hypothetical protein